MKKSGEKKRKRGLFGRSEGEGGQVVRQVLTGKARRRKIGSECSKEAKRKRAAEVNTRKRKWLPYYERTEIG